MPARTLAQTPHRTSPYAFQRLEKKQTIYCTGTTTEITPLDELAAAPLLPPTPADSDSDSPQPSHDSSLSSSSSPSDDSSDGAPSAPSRTEQRTAWSCHLQLPHDPPKWPGRCRHSGNAFPPPGLTCPGVEHAVQGPAARRRAGAARGRCPRLCTRIPLMYDGRLVQIRATVTTKGRAATFRPGRPSTA